MWDDFQIGEKANVCSATKFKDSSLSVNSCEFWWRFEKYNIGGKINKQSEVGLKLLEIIRNSDVINADIDAFLLPIAIQNMDPISIIEKMYAIKEKSFQEGRKNKVKELKTFLKDCFDL